MTLFPDPIFRFLNIFLITFIMSCNSNTTERNKVYYNQITKKDISDVISAIFEIDSINNRLTDIRIVASIPKYIPRDSIESFIPKPPPSSPYLFPEIASELKDMDINVKFSEDDRIFFLLQETNSQKLDLDSVSFSLPARLSRSICKEYFYTSIPIFNKKKNIVIVQYSIFCGGLCGYGKTIVLKKLNHWKKIGERIIWVS